jgi:pilus assembly protein CpaE
MAAGGGAVYTILSAGGGCGSTTLAVNLANELQLAQKAPEGRALVVDLDTVYGAVGSYLGVEGEYGILDLLARNGPLDGHLVETSTVAYGDRRLHALVSTASAHVGDPVVYDPSRLASAVAACASGYPATVIDAPRVGLAAAAELMRESDVTLLLMQLTVKDIRAARRMIGSLAPAGTNVGTTTRGSIFPVVSRYSRRGAMITFDEAKRALGGFELGVLPNDFPAAAQSLNLGKPLAQCAPKSELRREIQQLAAKLTAAHARNIASAASAAASPASMVASAFKTPAMPMTSSSAVAGSRR